MKKIIIPLVCVITIIGLVSCGDGNNSTETNVDSVSTTTSESNAGSTSNDGNAAMSSGQRMPSVDRKYIDLTSGSEVTVQKDEKSGYYINSQTRNQVEYFFDPVTQDTFDFHGHLVNMALSRDASGKYITDEAKVKVQGDGDLKIKDDNTDTKIKLDADGEGKTKMNGAKEKTEGDNYKYKDDSTKIKIRDGKLKVKN